MMSKSVELYLCIYARDFPAQALLRLRPELRDKAFAVLEGDPPLQTVCSLNAKARGHGITHGMTKVEIDTVPSVITLQRSFPEEAATKKALLECAGTCSPRIEDQSYNSCFLCAIDIAGTERLFGSPQIVAQNLLRRIRALGIFASAAVSNNFYVGECVAQFTSQLDVSIIKSGGECVALASLPVSALNLSEDQSETFSLWGIHTLGMLAGLPERELIARMGQEGKRLRQLARGESPHLFVPLEPEFRLHEYKELDSPVELLDSLLFVVGVMIEQLVIRATERVLALASVSVILSLEGGATYTRIVRPALPTNDRQLWIKLIHLDLEAHPPSAAILALTLTAEPGITSKVQLGLFSPQLPEPMRLDITLARIRAIVGDECVGSPVLEDTHQPDACRIEPFTITSGTTSVTETTPTIAAMRWLRPAENVSVALCSQQPTAFTFRQKRYDVERAYGPWITSGDWYNPTLWRREQWDLIARAKDGTLLCCCVARDAGQNTYQMVALYD
jgi:protein ImuB